MFHSTFFDVTIIGAGPSGSTAAKQLQDAGARVALLDKAKFPRHKTCASWINRLAFEEFPYLQSRLDDLVEVPFYGIRFFNHNFSRSNVAFEKNPSGYLTLRSKFDNTLKDLAVESGARFFEETSLQSFRETPEGLEVLTTNGEVIVTRILIGADGVNSKVAELARLRSGWDSSLICLCANEDVPYDANRIQKFYGERFPINVVLQFQGLEGYGWLFPKRAHICIGLGGRWKEGLDVRTLYKEFFQRLKQQQLIPAELESNAICCAIDPAGAVHRGGSLVRGRVMLIGDAAGFVSGSTGEGIYPAMVSARVASRVIQRALQDDPAMVEILKAFDSEWKQDLGHYIKNLPGGEQRTSTLRRLEWIFKSNLVCRVAAKVFLYGQNPDWKSVGKSVWS